MENGKSVLQLNKLVFDEIKFKRLGLYSDKKLGLKFKSTISQRGNDDLYKVTLSVEGNKPEEYIFEISLTGYFAIVDKIQDDLKTDLLQKSAVAILTSYLRSEVSLLTAQPGVEPVVLPPFNLNSSKSWRELWK